MKVPGRLRRLRFESLWEQRKLADADAGQLMMGQQGPVYSSPQMACAFERKTGKQLWRQGGDARRGGLGGRLRLAASAVRVCGFEGKGAGARWLRDHDGLRIGPPLLRQYGLLFTLSDERVALAFNEATGREMWRLAPPRTRRSYLSIHAHRALLATDSGYLYGLGMSDGQVRFRISASLPFLGAPVPWGKRFLATLGQGSNFALLLSDAHSGEAAVDVRDVSSPCPRRRCRAESGCTSPGSWRARACCCASMRTGGRSGNARCTWGRGPSRWRGCRARCW